MDNTPFDDKEQPSPPEPDNTPITFLGSGEKTPALVEPSPGTDRFTWYIVAGFGLIAIVIIILGSSRLFNSIVPSSPKTKPLPNPSQTPEFRLTATPDIVATQKTWVKPAEDPTLSKAEDVNRDNFDLVSLADSSPNLPDINMPGDVYVYEIDFPHDGSFYQPKWEYGWCAASQQILSENLDQMQVSFFVNGTEVTQNHIDIWDDQNADTTWWCRSFTTLVTSWPVGLHQLEIRVTFLKPTDDGANVYPAGTHIFRYFVNVHN